MEKSFLETGRDRVCLTTYVYGERYQAYIPFLVYTCHKSNPEYDIVLFVGGRVSEQVRKSLDVIHVDNCRIIENAFDDCPKMTPLKAMSLRWVLWDETFLNYDYIYIVDIDMLYLKENMPLHQQHLIHISTTGLSFDNMRRRYLLKPFNITTMLQRIKYAGFQNFLSFLFGDKIVYRASGLHFIKVKDYYSKFTEEYREHYKKLIYNNKWLKDVKIPDNEALLYHMLDKAELHPEKLPTQSNPYSSIDFQNPGRVEFRPHHGIHLGLFRSSIGESEKSILECSTYKYYSEVYKEDLLNDILFTRLINEAPTYIKNSFMLMYNYYGFETK